jgi:selenocysteine-specific elongation factor
MLPIDRAFIMKGFGPVVTGTLISGEITEGQELELLPPALKVRARGLQVHGKPVTRAFAGQRTAANLGSVDASAIERGMVLAPVGRLRSAQILDTELEMLPSAPYALRSRARVRFHLHTVEALGRVRVLSETGEIVPGGKGFVQISLEAPVIAHAGERFILRSYSPSITIAGGRILNPAAAKHRGKELARVRQTLTNLSNGSLSLQLSTFVTQAKDQGLRLSDLVALTGWTDAVISEGLKEALRGNNVVDCEGVLISREDFDRLSDVVKQAVQAHHKREPLSRGLARETLRERNFAHSPPEVFRCVLTRLEREGVIVSDKDVVREKGHSLELAGADADLRDRLERAFREAGLEPGSIDATLRAAAGEKSDVNRNRRILQMLIDEGKLVRIQPEMIFHRQALNGLIAKLRDYASKHEPDRTIDVPAFKDLAGISRKYAIPLLEYMDRERVTRRNGDRREILRPAEERK